MLAKMLACERGQGLLEYSVIVGFIAMAAFGAAVLLGHSLNNSLSSDVDRTLTIW